MTKTTNQPSSALYEQMGIAALLPGMQRAYEALGAEIEQMRERLGMLQHPAKRGRPPVNRDEQPVAVVEPVKPRADRGGSSSQKKYWAKLTPEQRSAEMLRRQALWAKNIAKKEPEKKPAKPMIYDPAHPGNKAWVAKMRRAAKKRWANAPKGTNRLPPAAKHVNGVAA